MQNECTELAARHEVLVKVVREAVAILRQPFVPSMVPTIIMLEAALAKEDEANDTRHTRTITQ